LPELSKADTSLITINVGGILFYASFNEGICVFQYGVSSPKVTQEFLYALQAILKLVSF
jgi:hypothetical protein